MLALEKKEIQWNVDLLVIRDATLLSHGWCAAKNHTFEKLEFVLQFEGGGQQRISAQYGADRQDVQGDFPDLNANCGFYVYATLDSSQLVRSVSIELRDTNGAVTLLQCQTPPQIEQERRTWMQWWSQQRQILLGTGRGILRAIRQGQWRKFWLGALAWRTRIVPRLQADDAVAKVFAQLKPGAVLILDHSLGGGSNIYRAELVKEQLRLGHTVLVWTFVLNQLQHDLTIFKTGAAPSDRLSLEWRQWRLILASGKVGKLIYNNSVSFPQPERVPAMLAAFRKAGGAHLQILVHDFYMVCPSHFLLNSEGKFCGVPSREQCRQCLPQVDEELAKLFVSRDIDAWREAWGNTLNVADEIVHFSRSSRQIVARAYPDIRESQWVFSPHAVPPMEGQFLYPATKSSVTVGVVGHIGIHKGSAIVLALQDEIRRQNADVRLIIVGGLQLQPDVPGITQTGSYERKNLCGLLNAHGVQIALMPSIVSETFSYVTHELIALQVPIMSFDIGAQAEAVSAYRLGRVVPFVSAEELLTRIQDFKHQLDGQLLV